VSQEKTSINKNDFPALNEIASAVRNIKFGQIVITVHNSKIVQVDKTEKLRFDTQQYEKGAGI
jgi:hypothetical protein